MLEVIRARKGNVKLLGIKIEPEEPFMVYRRDETVKLTARAVPRSASKGNITWSTVQYKSDTYPVISVDQTGLVTITSTYGTAQYESEKYGIRADSDAGFSDTVKLLIGMDVTSAAWESNSVTIDGVKGVVIGFTSTPVGASIISLAFKVDDETKAHYDTEFISYRHLLGLAAGQTTLRVIGRSGNAEGTCSVTVREVPVESIDARIGNHITSGQSVENVTIPKFYGTKYAIPNCLFAIPVYFFPYNTTDRMFDVISDNPAVAEVAYIQESPYNWENRTSNLYAPVSLYRNVYIRSKSSGTAHLTISGARGTTTEMTIEVVDDIRGRADGASGLSPQNGYLGTFVASRNGVAVASGIPEYSIANGFPSWEYDWNSGHTKHSADANTLYHEDYIDVVTRLASGYSSGFIYNVHYGIRREDGTEYAVTNNVVVRVNS